MGCKHTNLDTGQTIYRYDNPADQVLFDNTVYLIEQLLTKTVNGKTLWELTNPHFNTRYGDYPNTVHVAMLFVRGEVYMIKLNYCDFAEIDCWIDSIERLCMMEE